MPAEEPAAWRDRRNTYKRQPVDEQAWVPFPQWVIRDPRLPPGARCLYAELQAQVWALGNGARSKQMVEINIEQLAVNLAVGEKTVRRWLVDLERIDLIQRRRLVNQRRGYVVKLLWTNGTGAY